MTKERTGTKTGRPRFKGKSRPNPKKGKRAGSATKSVKPATKKKKKSAGTKKSATTKKKAPVKKKPATKKKVNRFSKSPKKS